MLSLLLSNSFAGHQRLASAARALALGACVLAVSGCVRTLTYGAATYSVLQLLPVYNREYATAQNAKEYEAKHYSSSIVEVDDEGLLRDSTQLRNVLVANDTLARHYRLLTLVYVHGWGHNAQADDSDLEHVNQLADSLTALLNVQTGAGRPWRVHPVYIGWRGRSWVEPAWYNGYLPIFWKGSTFWDRKDAAERVGRGGLTAVLSGLSAQWRESRLSNDPIRRQNSLIVIGHSFGGGAVLTSTLPLVLSGLQAERFAAARLDSGVHAAPSDLYAPGVADLVIAINPAIEAMALENTVYSVGMPFRSDGKKVTRLLIMDAENDVPRKLLFPMGRAVSQVLDWHHFESEHVAAGRNGNRIGYELFAPPADTPVCSRYHTDDPDYPGKSIGYAVAAEDEALGCLNSVMSMRATRGDAVIDGHSGFWTPGIRDFLIGFVSDQARNRMRVESQRQVQASSIK